MANPLLQIPKISSRKLVEYTYTKELPKTLVQATEESMPTAIVSNRQRNTLYTISASHWEPNSELGTPWVTNSTLDIEKSGAKTKVSDLIRFDVDKYNREQQTTQMHLNQEDYVPKPNALPFAYQGWCQVYNDPSIQPQTVLFSKEDCYAATDSAERPTVRVALPADNKKQLEKALAYFEDSRFVLSEIGSWDCKFVVTGKLSPSEWAELNFTPAPKAPDPCGMEHVIPNKNEIGCEIPAKMHGNIHPEWANKGKFYISYEKAIEENKKYPHALHTPEVWVQKVLITNHHSWRTKKNKDNVSIELTKLAGSTLMVSEATWENNRIYFSTDKILTWPNSPIPCNINDSSGILANCPHDPHTWQRVRQDSCDDGITYLYQNSDHKKGYHKITVKDLIKQSAELQAQAKAERELGAGFEEKYSKHLTFYTEEVDKYIQHAKFIDTHELAEWPRYIERKRTLPRHQHGIYTKEEVQEALTQQADVITQGNTPQESLLVYLILQKKLPKESQEILLDSLEKCNKITGELVKEIISK